MIGARWQVTDRSDDHSVPSDYVPPGYDPPSPAVWMGMAIAATLLCCLPFGVVGIVYAALAIEARNRGDVSAWDRRVRLARGWTILSILPGVVLIIVAVVRGFDTGAFS
jgi:hypothetical protein